MKLTPEQFTDKYQRITDSSMEACQKVFSSLNLQEELKGQFELFQPKAQKVFKRDGLELTLNIESLEKDSLEEVQKRQAAIVEVLDSLKEKMHPMLVFLIKLQGEIAIFLKGDLEEADLKAFKAKFNEMLEAHIEIEVIEPSELDNLKSVFNALLGVILTIATLGLVFAVNKEWACSFFSSGDRVEIRHDALEGKYEENLNDKLRDELVDMVTAEQDTPESEASTALAAG